MAKLTNNANARVRLGADLTISRKQYDVLLSYLFQAVAKADEELSQRVALATYVDKSVFLFKTLTDTERKLQAANEEGKQRHSVRAELPSVDAHIEAAVTDIMDVLMPIGNTYQGVTKANLQPVVNAITDYMERDSELFDHENAVHQAVRDAFMYNIGGFSVDWQVLQTDEVIMDGSADMTSGIPSAILSEIKGNELCVLDPYNTFFDPVVKSDPTKAYRKAEFVGTHYTMNAEEFTRRIKADEFFNVTLSKDFKFSRGLVNVGGKQTYFPSFRARPTLLDYVQSMSTADADYFQQFAFMFENNEFVSQPGTQLQMTDIYIRLQPKIWGLTSGENDKYEIWKFVIAEGTTIVRAEKVNTPYGYLPYFFSNPSGHGYGTAAPSYAYKLIPIQDWLIERLVTRNKADRRRLYGETYYDPHRIPQVDPDYTDAVAARIPVTNTGSLENPVAVRDAIQKYYESPDVSGLQADFTVAEIMFNKVLPISSRQMIADLQRATQHQSVHAALTMNKPMLRLAKRIDVQMLSPARSTQLRNHELMQGPIEIDNPSDPQNPTVLDPQKLIGSRVDFSVGGGLQGFDIVSKQAVYTDMMNILVQSSQAANVDFLKFVGYMSQLMGENTDFEQFRLASPMDALPKEQRDLAFQLLQQLAAQQQEQTAGPASADPSATPI